MSPVYRSIVNREYASVPTDIHLSSSRYHLEKFALDRTLNGHRGCVNSVLFSSDGTNILTGSDDTTIKIYSVEEEKEPITLRTAHSNNIFYANDLPGTQGNEILSCAADGRVILQFADRSRRSVLLYKHVGRAHRMAMIPSCSNQFYSCGEDGVICYYDSRRIDYSKNNMTDRSTSQSVMEARFLDPDQTSASSIYSIHVNPVKLNEICVAGAEAFVAIYDIRRFEKPVSFWSPRHLFGTSKHITGIRYDYSGEEIIASFSGEAVYRFSVVDHMKQTLADFADSENEADESVDDSPNFLTKYMGHCNIDTVKQVNFFGSRSEFVVSGSDCGHVFFWEKSTGNLLKLLKADSVGAVNCLTGHPWLPIFATSGLENAAKLWAPTGLHESMREGTCAEEYGRRVARDNERGHDRHNAALRRRMRVLTRIFPVFQNRIMGGSSSAAEGMEQFLRMIYALDGDDLEAANEEGETTGFVVRMVDSSDGEEGMDDEDSDSEEEDEDESEEEDDDNEDSGESLSEDADVNVDEDEEHSSADESSNSC